MSQSPHLHRNDGGSASKPVSRTRRPISVLVAEDLAFHQILVRRVLERLGYQVAIASDGLDVVRQWQASPETYDVILMDIQLPHMDGLEATRRIRLLEGPTRRPIPIVAYSTQSLLTDKYLCLSAGMNDYVSKPSKPHILNQALERAVAARM